MVQIPAEVLEEQRLRMGDLKSRAINITVELDHEAFVTGLEHPSCLELLQI